MQLDFHHGLLTCVNLRDIDSNRLNFYTRIQIMLTASCDTVTVTPARSAGKGVTRGEGPVRIK